MERRMKIFIALSLLTAILVLPFTFYTYQVFYVEPLLSQYPEAFRPLIDYQPFFATIYGRIALFTWMGLLIIWLPLGLLLQNKNKESLSKSL